MPKSKPKLNKKEKDGVFTNEELLEVVQAGKNSKDGKGITTKTEYTSAMRYIYDNLIGSSVEVQSPFGDRRMTYADYTASGRSLYMIENYLTKYVMSYYGNTHTSTSFASMQTSKFREDAKAIIRRACNASADDAVIFCGSGATAAINKLIGVLGLCDKSVARSTVVFLGPYEHHSNILPWKETGARLVRIKEDRKGQFDVEDLERQLRDHSQGPWRYKLGTFSACSNVTGLVVDTVKITTIMHAYGGLAFWDYAAGAPYLKMDMNPRTDSGNSDLASKDGIFCSPHKFVGGPGSPGILIAKKKLFTNEVPHATGGGTVVYVTHNRHSYSRDVESREEGGTPGIIESIRAGLVFQLKNSIGIEQIHKREMYLARKGINALHGNPNIILLGSKISPRVPILSFAIRHPASKKLVHHNFIALLLSDLFGIQARGGCACAGPYAQDLMGIAEEVAEGIMAFLDVDVRRETIISLNEEGKGMLMEDTIKIANSLGIMKPGFVRLNLAYFMPDEEIEYLLTAVNIIANEGWKLLPQYSYDVVQGSWVHRRKNKVYDLMSLDDIAYDNGKDFHMTVNGAVNPRSEPGHRQSYAEIMRAAEKVIESADTAGRELYPFDEITMKDYLPDSLLSYVWWLEPQHAMLTLNNQNTKSLMMMKVNSIPIKPRTNSGPVAKLALSNRFPNFQINSAHNLQFNGENKGDLLPMMNPNVPERVKNWVNSCSTHSEVGEVEDTDGKTRTRDSKDTARSKKSKKNNVSGISPLGRHSSPTTGQDFSRRNSSPEPRHHTDPRDRDRPTRYKSKSRHRAATERTATDRTKSKKRMSYP